MQKLLKQKEGKNKNNNMLIRNQQPKIEEINDNVTNNPNVSTYEHQANVVVGPRNVGKTYYMLRILEKLGNQTPIHIIT